MFDPGFFGSRRIFVAALLLGSAGWAAEPAPAPAPAPPAAVSAAPVTFYATATVREKPLASATGAVTVLDREALASQDTVLAALEQVAGLTFVSGATRGGSTLVQIRGGDPNFTQVLIDGVPVNDGTYQQGEVFNFEALPAAAFERAEIVRGPLSAYYGATGLAGAIQLFTRHGDGPPRGEAAVRAGDAGAYRASASCAGGGERADAFVLALAEGEERRIAEESFALFSLQGQVRLRPNARTSVQLAARLADWNAGDYPEGSGGPRLGSGELRHSDHRELGASLQLARSGAGREQRLDLAFYRHRLDRDSPAIFPLVPAASEDTLFSRVGLGWAASWQIGHSLQWSAGGGDVGIFHRFAGGFELDLTLFRQLFEDLVDFDFASFLHVNRAEVDSRGVELAASFRPGPRLSAALAAGWLEVEDAETGERLRHRPRRTLSLRLARQLSVRCEAEGRWRYVSASYDEEIPLPGLQVVGGYHLVAAAGNYRLAPSWRLEVRIDNLLDARFETLAGFPGPGRSARLGIRYSPGRS